jgi:hypothetical protein
MDCKSCQSEHQRNLNGEIAIPFPGLKGLDKPIVWVFPKLQFVCVVASRNSQFLPPNCA